MAGPSRIWRFVGWFARRSHLTLAIDDACHGRAKPKAIRRKCLTRR
jgi:hypothetical protein